jgi:hypothetical protein
VGGLPENLFGALRHALAALQQQKYDVRYLVRQLRVTCSTRKAFAQAVQPWYIGVVNPNCFSKKCRARGRTWRRSRLGK